MGLLGDAILHALNYHESRVTGSTTKHVRCENCDVEYSYSMQRMGVCRVPATRALDSEADRKASADLQEKLQNGCDPVPCPACGWYQADMIARARFLRYRWMAKTAWVMFPLAALSMLLVSIAWRVEREWGGPPFYSNLCWVVAGLLAAAIVALVFGKLVLTALYDPNRHNTNRRQRGYLSRRPGPGRPTPKGSAWKPKTILVLSRLRRSLGPVLLVLGIPFVATLAVMLLFPAPPADNAYVGKTRAQIVKEWGAPTQEWDGHYGNPSLEFTQQYGPAKSLVFERWSGRLYVSLHEVDGQWVCFCSTWMSRGQVF